jgi:hypothetical protein
MAMQAVFVALQGAAPQAVVVRAGHVPSSAHSAGTTLIADGGEPEQLAARHATPAFGVLQAPATQVVLWQTLPSQVQVVPSITGTCMQPEASQESAVQSFASSHFAPDGVPWHEPTVQTSGVVQAIPSSHAVPFRGVTMHVAVPLQARVLQASFVQVTEVPAHFPAAQASS